MKPHPYSKFRSLPVWAAAAFALASSATPVAAQMQLASESEVRDGEIHDVASQYDARIAPETKRAWVAEGRVRAAIRLSDFVRITAEDRTFNRLDPAIDEWVLKVEVDDLHGYLYTLTAEGVLYRDSIASPYSPAAPGDNQFLKLKNGPLVPALDATETLQDVRLIPGSYSDNYVLVMTNFRPIIVRSNAAGLSFLAPVQGSQNAGQSLELFNRMTDPQPFNHYLSTNGQNSSFDLLRVQQLRDVVVDFDANGKLVAYVIAGFTKYESSGRVSVVHPYCQLLLLCDLDAAHGFTAPRFNTENFPSGLNYAYWNPYASYTGPGNDVQELRSHSLYGLATRKIGGHTEVFAACGAQVQLHRLYPVFATYGISDYGMLTVDPSQDLLEIQADRSNLNRFYVHGSGRFFVYDLSTGFIGSIDQVPFTLGGMGDPAMTLLPQPGGGARKAVWFVGAESIDYALRLYDVTTPSAPTKLGQLGFLWRSDGGVALDFDTVYVPSWGGVRQYRRSAGMWGFGGYQPAQITELGVKKGFNTEQIAIGSLAAGDDRVFIAANTVDAGVFRNGILEFKLATAHRPSPASFIEFQPAWLGWTQAGFHFYSNDVVFLKYAGQSFLLIDVTRFGGSQPNETGLVAFRWDPSVSTWVFSGAAKKMVYVGLSTVITVSEAGGVPIAFVAGDFGVVSYDLTGITANPPFIQDRTFLDYFTQHGMGSWGMVAARSRIIVFYDHGTSSSPLVPDIVMYDWTTSGALAGTINTMEVQRITATNLVPNWGRTFRARYDPIDADTGYVYNCNDTSVYRLFYDANSARLTYDANWTSDYVGAIQDSRIYTFGSTKRMLVAKDAEAFAWVDI